jgi:hypothetical protein
VKNRLLLAFPAIYGNDIFRLERSAKRLKHPQIAPAFFECVPLNFRC